MPVEFRCTNCRRRLRVPRRWAGKAIECPRCKAKIVVPRQEGSSQGGAFESRSVERALQKLEPARRAEPTPSEDEEDVWQGPSLTALGDAEFEVPEAVVAVHAESRPVASRRGRRVSLTFGLLVSMGLAAVASAAIITAFWLFRR